MAILFRKLSLMRLLNRDVLVLVPMPILLLRLSPTMCVQGDWHPLLGSFHQILIRRRAQCKAGLRFVPHRFQIERGKHVSRPVGTRPDIIVLQLCTIVNTSALLPDNPLWLSLDTQL